MRNQREPTEHDPSEESDETFEDWLKRPGNSKTPPEKYLGMRVRQLRTQRGWSQEDLARVMQDEGHTWRQTTVAKTEAGSRPVPLAELVSLAACFGITANDLLPYLKGISAEKAHDAETETRLMLSLYMGGVLRYEDAARRKELADQEFKAAAEHLLALNQLLADAGKQLSGLLEQFSVVLDIDLSDDPRFKAEGDDTQQGEANGEHPEAPER